MDRIIREKKPWMLAAAAALLLGITIQFAGVSSAHNSVINDAYKKAGDRAQSAQTFASNLKSQTSGAVSAFNNVDSIGKNLTSNVEGRITWLELLRAVNAALPQSQPGANVPSTVSIAPLAPSLPIPSEPSTDPTDESQPDSSAVAVTAPPRPSPRGPVTSDSFAKWDSVYIESVEAIAVDGLSTWFEPFKTDNRYYPDDRELEELQAAGASGGGASTTSTEVPPAGESTENSAEEGAEVANTPKQMTEAERYALVAGPAGSEAAKVVQLIGHHFHNSRDRNEFAEDGGEAYLQKTLLYNLKFGEVNLPPTIEEQLAGVQSKKVSMKDLGISYPVLLYVPNVVEYRIVNPNLLDTRTGELPFGVFNDMDMGQQMGFGGSSTGIGRSGGGGSMGGMGGGTTPLSAYARSRGEREPVITVRRFDFVIQFAWEETPPSQRKLKEESTDTDVETAGDAL